MFGSISVERNLVKNPGETFTIVGARSCAA